MNHMIPLRASSIVACLVLAASVTVAAGDRPPAATRDRTAELSAKLDAVTSQLQDVATQLKTEIAGLKSQVNEVNNRVNQATKSGGAGSGETTAALRGELKAEIETVNSSLKNETANLAARVNQLNSQVNQLHQEIVQIKKRR